MIENEVFYASYFVMNREEVHNRYIYMDVASNDHNEKVSEGFLHELIVWKCLCEKNSTCRNMEARLNLEKKLKPLEYSLLE